jgi:hypothetical protein
LIRKEEEMDENTTTEAPVEDPKPEVWNTYVDVYLGGIRDDSTVGTVKYPNKNHYSMRQALATALGVTEPQVIIDTIEHSWPTGGYYSRDEQFIIGYHIRGSKVQMLAVLKDRCNSW